jgi:hypothetical protein
MKINHIAWRKERGREENDLHKQNLDVQDS